jgi:stage IV sporulation protein FB
MRQSIVWGILNLLPVWPLDGGQAMREVFYIFGLRRPDPAAHSLSVVAAALLVLFSLAQIVSPGHPAVSWFPLAGGPIWIVYFALLCVMNWQMLQQYNAQRSWEFEDREPWR